MTRNDLLLAVFVMAMWGFNFSMIKLGSSDIHPLLTTAARFSLAVVPAIFFVRKPEVPWRFLFAYGLIFGVGVWGMASWSITAGLSSGMSSILLSSNAIISVLVGVIIHKERTSVWKNLGALISLLALLTLVYSNNGNVTRQGLILIFIAAICWTCMGILVKATNTKQVFAFNIWGMIFSPLPLLIFAISIHGFDILPRTLEAWNIKTSIAVAFQAYPTTLFGYWAWNRLLLRYPLSTTAPLTLLVPMFALLSGYIFHDEKLNSMQTISCVLFLIGVGIIVIPRNRNN